MFWPIPVLRGYYSKAEFYEQFWHWQQRSNSQMEKEFTGGWNSTVSLLHTNFNYTISSVFVGNSLFVASKIEDLGVKWDDFF